MSNGTDKIGVDHTLAGACEDLWDRVADDAITFEGPRPHEYKPLDAEARAKLCRDSEVAAYPQPGPGTDGYGNVTFRVRQARAVLFMLATAHAAAYGDELALRAYPDPYHLLCDAINAWTLPDRREAEDDA